jgi:hypothetical protein
MTEPLRMSDTGFFVSDPQRLATPYADASPAAVRMTDCHLVPDSDGNLLTFAPTRLFNPKAFQSGGAGMVGPAPDLISFLETIRQGGAPILKPETANAALLNQIGDIPRPDKPGEGFSFLGAVIQDPVLSESPMSKGSVTWGGVYGHSWFIDPAKGISAAIMSNTAVEGCLESIRKISRERSTPLDACRTKECLGSGSTYHLPVSIATLHHTRSSGGNYHRVHFRIRKLSIHSNILRCLEPRERCQRCDARGLLSTRQSSLSKSDLPPRFTLAACRLESAVFHGRPI